MPWYTWVILGAYVGTAIAAYRFLRQPIDWTPTSYRCDNPQCLCDHPWQGTAPTYIERESVLFGAGWAVVWPLLLLIMFFLLLGD